jgi:glycosyltransferase involved in cell wall biosynthesis
MPPLTVVYYLDSAEFGGAEQALLNLLTKLDLARWRPILFHHAESGLAPLVDAARQLKIQITAIPRLDSKNRLTAARAFFRELRAESPSIFHAQLNNQLSCRQGLLLAALARIPARIGTTHLVVDLPTSVLLHVEQLIVTAGVQRYIAVSRKLARQLRTFGVPGNKIQVIHNAIPWERYVCPVNRELRERLGAGIGRKVVLTTARLNAQKGHSFLLQAATMVSNAVFVLAGDGPDREHLEYQARSLGIADRVLFLGYRTDVPELLSACDLFVLPSLFEGLPLSILEAMAAGRPVICSKAGGTDEAITDGETGLLVPPENPEELARAINRLLVNSALAQQVASAAKARVIKDFSASRMAERNMEIYEELTSNRHHERSL